MGKLGKKARKFAKKNLQSVLRQRRKNKAFLSKKKSPKNYQNDIDDKNGSSLEPANGRNADVQDAAKISLDSIFKQDGDLRPSEDVGDSDGYLSEDSNLTLASERENGEGDRGKSSLSTQNLKIQEDIIVQKKKLKRYRSKDPEFEKFLLERLESIQNDDMYSDEDDEMHDQRMQLLDEQRTKDDRVKVLTSSAIDSWCQLVKEGHNKPALICLLNAYRAACHYGAELSSLRFQDSDTFCKILTFVLSEVDSAFQSLLEITSLKRKKETILELTKTVKWENLKSLVRSYLRSTLFLLSQVTDGDILAFALDRLRASVVFFAAFPSLLNRLTQTAVHLLATGGGVLSSASFALVRDVAQIFGSNSLETCLGKTFTAYITQNRVPEVVNSSHLKFLMDSMVELCSLDVRTLATKARASIGHLTQILLWGLQTKKKEAIKKICSWEYVCCIDLWVAFISANVDNYDLQALLFSTIQLINGIIFLFTGPRYFPLKLKCIRWLNNLSASSGIFVPVTSYVLDILEYKIVKVGRKGGKALNVSSVLKLPKCCLKSHSFQEECLSSATEQLSIHFAQWSHHISFPELATIPLIHVQKLHEASNTESFKRLLKRFIDQVEQNVDFVQRKRADVSFSPNDHQSVESFLQLEKCGKRAPFNQYYQSMMERAAQRSSDKSGKTRMGELNNSKRRRKEGDEGLNNFHSTTHSAIANGVSS